ncbi:MAG: replicative DNA helicase [Bacillota bacterium]
MEQGILGRIPPQSIEAEQSVLGAMMLVSDTIPDVLEILKPDDFYREDHREIFTVIVDLFNHAITVDLVTVADALKRRGSLDKIGGLDYLTLIPTLVPITANAQRYATIIAEKSLLRTLIKVSSMIVDKGYDASDEAMAVLEYAEAEVLAILSGRAHQGFHLIRDVIAETVKELEFKYNNQNMVTGVPTGFHELDKLLSGLQKSDLIIIAGRPAMGKTTLGLNIAQHAASKAKVATAVFSLEMSKEQLVARMLATQALIPSNKLRDGSFNDDDWANLSRSIGPLSDAPIYIDDNAGVSITDIRAKCRKLKMENKLGLIVIDYLQLMDVPGKRNENRQSQITEISRSLKILAKELNVPVICLSQLSRGPEARTNNRPMLSDLRDSGAIEQDADIVMFIYRDDYYNKETDKPNVAEIIVAKHRNGETRTIELGWSGTHTRFFDLEKHRE